MIDMSGWITEAEAKQRVEKALQKEANKSGKFWLGVFFGMCIGVVCMMAIAGKEVVFYNKAQNAKAQCEAELPRNKQCKIVISAEVE